MGEIEGVAAEEEVAEDEEGAGEGDQLLDHRQRLTITLR